MSASKSFNTDSTPITCTSILLSLGSTKLAVKPLGTLRVLIPFIVIVFCFASAKLRTTVMLSSLNDLTPDGLGIDTFEVFEPLFPWPFTSIVTGTDSIPSKTDSSP